MKRERQEPEGGGGGGGGIPGGRGGGGGGFYGQHPYSKGKSSMMDGGGLDEHDAAEDELLAALGYKVRASSMADVAQKLEQLEMAMTIGTAGGSGTAPGVAGGSAAAAASVAPHAAGHMGFPAGLGGGATGGGGMLLDDNAVVSHLAQDAVHYNPSDLSSWLESMLSELNVPPLPPPQDPVAALQQQVMDPMAMNPHLPHHVLYGGNRQQHLPPLPLAGPQALLIEDPLGPGESSTVTSVDFSSPCSKRGTDLDDLSAIIPRAAATAEVDAAATGPGVGRENKRIKSSASSSSSSTATTPVAAPPVGSNNSSGAHQGLSNNNNNSNNSNSNSSGGHPVLSNNNGNGNTNNHSSPPTSVVLVDSQETGIRLVHALLACAEAVQQENLATAEALVKQIGVLAMSQGGAMRKVATYFAEALARRIYRVFPPQDLNPLDSAFSDILQLHFYEACPYLKFAHFTANQAILEAFAGKRRVHVIDFSMKQGMQWPALMQALALRPEGPPAFRLTGIGPPQPDNTDALQQVGWKLAQLADSIQVQFEYRGFVASSLADLEPYMLDLVGGGKSSSSKKTGGDGGIISGGAVGDLDGSDEVIAVNSVFELHRLLGHPGAVEKVLGTIKALRPGIVTIVEQEANHNCQLFLDRFTEALHYYSSMFDSLEGCGGGGGNSSPGSGQQQPQPSGGDGQQDQVMTEVYLGRQICNVVACEGPDRTERHETAAQWRSRMNSAGFEAVPLGSNAFKQASMLLELFAGGDGYRVEEKDGCLMLGWHTRPLITTSAWRPTAAARRSV